MHPTADMHLLMYIESPGAAGDARRSALPNTRRSQMKHSTRFFLCSCLLLVLNAAALAQHGQDAPPPPNALLVEPVETYGDIPWAQERKRLDSLAALLSDDPNLIGYIVVYAGRRACAGEAQARALRAKNYLVGKRGIAGGRLVWRDAGHLSKPHVILETQVRGARQYAYAHPEPLPAKEVRILNCRGVMRNR